MGFRLFIRREIAPHLKSLMGPWWFSQFDSVSEVSQSAMQSLQVCCHQLVFSFIVLVMTREGAWIEQGSHLNLQRFGFTIPNWVL